MRISQTAQTALLGDQPYLHEISTTPAVQVTYHTTASSHHVLSAISGFRSACGTIDDQPRQA